MSGDALSAEAFQDRTTGLVLFGSLELLLGGCCGLLAPLSLVNVFVARSLPPSQMPTANVGPALFGSAFYVGLAAFLITTGIGSIRTRRWARTLILVGSWIALSSGLLGCITMALMFPMMQQQILAGAGAGAREAAAITTGVLIVMGAGMLVFYIALPAAFVLFYRSPHVKATCERKDPRVPWTDRCPAPVLAGSLLAALGALSLLSIAVTFRALPFFGTITGAPAVLIGVALAAIYAFAAVELYRQRWRGWWVLMATAGVLAVSGIVSFFSFDPVAFYVAMGYNHEWAERMAPMLGWMRWSLVLFILPWIGFRLWVKRYLAPTPDAVPDAPV